MNHIAEIKERVRTEEWEERVRQCRQNSINLKTYYYLLRKTCKEICENLSSQAKICVKESSN